MGLDDLSHLELVLPSLALLVTVVVGGPATVLSLAAWKWALSRLSQGLGVRVVRVASLLALLVTGFPAAYALGMLTALPGLGAMLGLLLVAGVALAGVVHAAFRDESVRALSENGMLAEELAALHFGERKAWLQGSGEAYLPVFAGATRRRALQRAAIAALLWVALFMVLFLAHR